jgi:hypothetical protein
MTVSVKIRSARKSPARNLNTHLKRQARMMKLRDVRVGKSIWASWRLSRGAWAGQYVPLLTYPNNNAKITKNKILTYSLALAPSNLSGWNTCPWSTPLCRKGCLNTAGRGLYPKVQRGRILKTQFLAEHPDVFIALLEYEIRLAVKRHGRILVRLNVLSDLEWELIAPQLFDIEGVEYYDYTKSKRRAIRAAFDSSFPSNYRLTYSLSERDNDDDILFMHSLGVKMAMVFDGPVPSHYLGIPVRNGDESDDRFNDDATCIVGLRAKGRMRRFASEYVGFTRPCQGVLIAA